MPNDCCWQPWLRMFASLRYPRVLLTRDNEAGVIIYTFYSYKGGVGRSMALANVGQWFYELGLRVVMIDWDLEAPGLENFFYSSSEELDLVSSQLGLIDMLMAYKRTFPRLRLPEVATDGAPHERKPGAGSEDKT